MRYYVTLPGGDERAIDVAQRPGGGTEVRVDGELVDVDAGAVEGALSVRVGARVFDLWLEPDGHSYGFVGGGMRTRALVESERSRMGAVASRPGGGGGCQVVAPMPGRVVKVLVEEGDVVEEGAPVIVVEAMKMENELCAEKPGVVTAVKVAEGENVDGGVTLVELGSLDEAS
ncbi:MAG: acetyl-CoA carboxylase biotin carboxyl carrier protein subunit [Deltaproteobacteria bacterium]|nr:acetyl-CoA carboxylase biotin carboxyl carrier protein subunit [Deltaproteobacteria bacterium]